MDRKRILRVVVASPRDVQAERDALPAIIAELNIGIAAERHVLLELHRWETDAYPGFHPEGPQGLIDPILKVGDCDILIGIFWKHFGTPTKEARSGTEHEILRAFDAWKRSRRPQIMVYFNRKPYEPKSKEESEQRERVLDFKRRFPEEGLWWEYEGEAQFEKLLRNHLTQLIRDQYSRRLSPRASLTWRRGALLVAVCALLGALGLTAMWRSRGTPYGGRPETPRTWEYQRALVGHMGTVYSVAFSRDGRTVAGGSYDKTITLWDAQTGVTRRTLTMSDKSLVYMLAFSPVGDDIAAGVGRDVLIADAANGAQPRALKGHTGLVFAVAYAPDGGTLASGGEDHTIRVWDVQTGRTLRVLTEPADEVNAVAFSPDGGLLAGGSYDGTIIVWDAATWAVKARLAGHVGHVYSVAFAPGGRTLASGGEDGTVRLWDAEGGALKRTLYGHKGAVNSVAYAPDGETLASAGDDGLVLLWDTQKEKVRQTLTKHAAGVTSVAFAPDGRAIVSGGKDRTVIVWGLQTSGAPTDDARPDTH